MNKWPKISNIRVQPVKGNYTDWKDQIALDCQEKCVYCAINDQDFGGSRNFHVEHFKPKSKPEFLDLENIITNLFYACSICNVFKKDDWHFTGPIQYICPSSDYNDIFSIEDNNYVSGHNNSSSYMIEKLHLNRVQLLSYREEMKILEGNKSLVETAQALLDKVTSSDHQDLASEAIELSKRLLKIIELRNKIRETPLYKSFDIKR